MKICEWCGTSMSRKPSEGKALFAARKFCSQSCSMRSRNAAGTITRRRAPVGRTCSIDGCDRVYKTRGLCNTHYERLRRHGDPLKVFKVQCRPGDHRRFIAVAVASSTNECILWPEGWARSPAGYGVSDDAFGRRQIVARMVLAETAGPPPSPNHQTAHAPLKCHEPACINPRHLRWATPAENAADKVVDGTQPFGEAVLSSKLTEAEVLEIVSLRRQGWTYAAIAFRFGVAPGTPADITTGKTWSWLTGIEPLWRATETARRRAA